MGLTDVFQGKKVIALALILIVVIIAGYFFFSGGLGGGEKGSITLKFLEDEKPLKGVKVSVTFEGEKKSFTSNEKGEVIITDILLGTRIKAEAELEGFQKILRELEVKQADLKLEVQMPSTEIKRTQIIKLVQGEDESLLTKKATYSLSCTNSEGKVEPSTGSVSDGVIKAVSTEKCGSILLQASADGFISVQSFEVKNASEKVLLKEVEVSTGKIKVTVKDDEQKSLDGIRIQVFNESGVEKFTESSVQGLKVIPEVQTGEYYVSVSDSKDVFGTQKSVVKRVNKNQETLFEFVLSKSIKGKINVKAIDDSTKAELSNVKIQLFKKGENTPISDDSTKAGEKVSFSITEKGLYIVRGLLEGFLYGEEEVDLSEGEKDITLKLVKATPENSGKIVVSIKDEDNKPIESAEVFVFDGVTDFLYPFESKLSDANGETRFSGLKEGTYFMKAVKGNLEAISSKKKIDIRKEFPFEIKMQRGNGTLSIEVVDLDNKSIPNARIQLHLVGETDIKEALGNPEGKSEISLKGDSRVYVRVSAEGFAAFFSQAVPIEAGEEAKIKAVLEKTIPGRDPKIKLLGIFVDESSQIEITELKPGTNYIARLQVKIPENADYRKVGIHFRTGKLPLMEQDNILIKEVIAPNADVRKGTTFNPPLGQAIDLKNISFAEAKWANVVLRDVEKGVYNIAVSLRVKTQVVQGDDLPFYYRVWAETPSKEFLRDPIDSELGNARSTSTKEELYAEAYSKRQSAGLPSVCDETFCYSGERILDLEDKKFKLVPYDVSVFGVHKFFFEITNNSETVHDRAEIRIKNFVEGKLVDDALELIDYKIVNADAKEFKSSGISLNKLPEIELGSYTRNKTVKGEITFIPKKVGRTNLQLEIVSGIRVGSDVGGSKVFEKIIPINVLANKKLKLELKPSILPSFIDNKVEVKVTDEESITLKNVKLRVSKITPANVRIKIGEFYSNANGNAFFTLPSSSPGSKFIVESELTGFESQKTEVKIASEIVAFDPLPPNPLKLELQTIGIDEDTATIKATNLIDAPLKLKKAFVSGYFKSYLDEAAMNRFLQGFVETTELKKDEEQNLSLLKAKLVNALQLFEPDKVKGEINLVFESVKLGKTWAFSIPFEVSVEIGKGPSADNCLVLEPVPLSSIPKWNSVTQGERIANEFILYNSCKINGKPVEVRNLKAGIEWKGNKIGDVQLTLTDQEEHTAVPPETLREGEFTNPFIEIVKALQKGSSGPQYTGILYFTPKAGHEGEDTSFTVKIRAEIGTNQGPKEISTTQDITGNIKVINLKDCLELTPTPEEGLKIPATSLEGEGFFEIDSTKCGPATIQISICRGDDGCRGNPQIKEGGLRVEPKTFNLSKSKQKQKIKLKKEEGIPGIYGVTIFASPGGSNFVPVKTLDVLIEPNLDEHYFWLDKYEFSVIGREGKDSTALFNTQYKENVSVEAKRKYHGQAAGNNATKAFWTGAIAGVGTGAATVGALIAAEATVPVIGWTAAIVTIVVWAAVSFLTYQKNKDKANELITKNFEDYVIELTSDRRDVLIEGLDNKIKAEWNTKYNNVFSDSRTGKVTQINALKFLNDGNLSKPQLSYGILNVKAIEHIHGDPTHKAARVLCGNSDFWHFNIPSSCSGARDELVSKKFHVRFKTQEEPEPLPELNFETFECKAGALRGVTGKGANPKIKLDWDWDKIKVDSCDANNPETFYCDSTQFSISLVKRLNKLKEFFERNQGVFECPPSISDAYDKANNQESSNVVKKDFIGISKLETKFYSIENDANAIVFLDNKTTSDQSIDLTVNLKTLDNEVIKDVCEKKAIALKPGTNKVGCEFKAIQKGNYFIEALITNSSTQNLDPFEPTISIIVQDEPLTSTVNSTCKVIKTTEDLQGSPIIMAFIEAQEKAGKKVEYSTDTPTEDWINNKEELLNTIKFDAFLMKDGYSSDFRKDFIRFYTTQALPKAPDYFDNTTAGKGRFKDFFEDNEKLVFTQKFFERNSTLDSPGRYRVELMGYFKDKWEFFDSQGKPNALMIVSFYRLNDPQPNSPFYSMPIDGLVGLDGTSLERQGYGTQFLNKSDQIAFNKTLATQAAKTYADAGSNAIARVSTQVGADYRKLNSDLGFRGNLLNIIRSPSGEMELDYSPNYATPVILKMSHAIDPNKFGAYYVLEDSRKGGVEVGGTLNYWQGLGACIDFSGKPVFEAFDFAPDRSAKAEDRIPNWEQSYTTQWNESIKEGDVYLRTEFYTPIGSTATLRLIHPTTNAKFISSNTNDKGESTVTLNGINGMEFNNPTAANRISSIQDILSLVESGNVCVTNNGLQSRYWWNPKKLFNQGQTKLEVIATGLGRDSNAQYRCIG